MLDCAFASAHRQLSSDSSCAGHARTCPHTHASQLIRLIGQIQMQPHAHTSNTAAHTHMRHCFGHSRAVQGSLASRWFHSVSRHAGFTQSRVALVSRAGFTLVRVAQHRPVSRGRCRVALVSLWPPSCPSVPSGSWSPFDSGETWTLINCGYLLTLIRLSLIRVVRLLTLIGP